MANIDTLLQQILTAVYGEDVRGSIHDAIAAMNEESSEAISVSKTAQDSAKNSADAAAKSATDAADAVADLDNKHTSAVTDVANAKTDALDTIATEKEGARKSIASDKNDALTSIANEKTDALDTIATEKEGARKSIASDKNDALTSIANEKTNSITEITASKTDALDSISSANAKAEAFKTLSQSYAEGGTGTREGEDTNNAKYYMEQAQKIASGGIAIDSFLDPASVNPVQNKVITASLNKFKEAIAESEFLAQYELANESTTIAKDSDDNSVITETKSNGVATTNFAKTDDTTTITTKVVPTAGDYNYTQTTTITKSEDGTTSITSSYTKETKAA